LTDLPKTTSSLSCLLYCLAAVLTFCWRCFSYWQCVQCAKQSSEAQTLWRIWRGRGVTSITKAAAAVAW